MRHLITLSVVLALLGCDGTATRAPVTAPPVEATQPGPEPAQTAAPSELAGPAATPVRRDEPPTERLDQPAEPAVGLVPEPVTETPSAIAGGLGAGASGALLPEEPEPESLGGGLGEGTTAPLLPVPELPSRERRRMDIDQLDATLKAVTGGVSWTIGNDNQFEALARTLGKPDYLDLTNEDLESSALFAKFLDDAARSVCAQVVQNDLEASPGERWLLIEADVEDTLETAPLKIRSNLQVLLLRFHGRKLSSQSPSLGSWLWLWESAEHMSGDPVAAWRTVCVALIKHPDFTTY